MSSNDERSKSSSLSSDHNPGESEPLIADPISPAASSGWRQEELHSKRGLRNGNSRRVLICVFGLIVLNQFCSYLTEVPIVRLIEKVICEKHHEGRGDDIDLKFDGDVDEKLCKIPAIQSELAKIIGLKSTFDAIPGKYLASVAAGTPC